MKKEQIFKTLRTILGLAILVAAFIVGYRIFTPNAIAYTAPGASKVNKAADNYAKSPVVVDGILETDEIDISSKIPGRISIMNVAEGDEVRAGQIVVEIEAEEIDAKQDQAVAGMRAAEAQASQGDTAVSLERKKDSVQISQAQAGIASAKATLGMAHAKLKALEKGARPQEIFQAEQGVEAAQAAYDTANKSWKRIKGLADEGVVSQQKADEVEMVYRSANAQLAAAKAKLDMVKEGARVEEIDAARQQVKQAEAGVDAAEQTLQLAKDGQMMVDIRKKDAEAARQKVAATVGVVREVAAYKKQTRIVSPITGRISQRMSQAGEIVAPGYAIMTVTRTDKYWVTVYVDESKFTGHRLGEVVQVDIPALQQTFQGKISKLLPAADFATKRATNEKGTYDVRSLQLRISLSGNLSGLSSGITARVHLK